MPRLRYIDGRMVEEPLPHEVDRVQVAPAWPVAVSDTFGEAVGRSIADTRGEVERRILDATDGTPAARAWAARKATEAAQRFTRSKA